MQISKLNCYTPAIVRVHIHDNLDIPYPILIWVCWYDENNTRELQLYTWYSTKFVLRCKGTLAQPCSRQQMTPWPLTSDLCASVSSWQSSQWHFCPYSSQFYIWGEHIQMGTRWSERHLPLPPCTVTATLTHPLLPVIAAPSKLNGASSSTAQATCVCVCVGGE